jgi:Tfp pilus assembly protein PilO
MSRNRLNMLIAVLAMAVVAAAGFFLGVQPQLAQAASNKVQQITVEATNVTTATELTRLRQRAKTLPQMQAELAALQASVPSAANMSSFYTEIDRIAASSGVTVSAITTSDAIAYTSPASASSSDAATSAATAAPSTGSTPEPSATASASAAPTAPAVTTDPAITAANFSVIPVSVSVDGSFDQALSFVSGTADGARLFLVDSISSSTSQSSATATVAASTTWTFAGYVYVLLAADDTPATTSANG